jgi:hypothetical protein
LASPPVPALALDAAVAAVARVMPPGLLVVAAPVPAFDGGFAREVSREGRALAFSLSLSVAVRVVRVTRRV